MNLRKWRDENRKRAERFKLEHPEFYPQESRRIPVDSDNKPKDAYEIALEREEFGNYSKEPTAPVSVPTNEVSGEQVKRYAPVLDWDIVDGAKKFKPLMVEVASAPKLYVSEADHLSALSKLQGRVEELEAAFASQVAHADLVRDEYQKRLKAAESKLATYKASLPERAKRAANIFGGSPSAIHQLSAIILAEMTREKE